MSSNRGYSDSDGPAEKAERAQVAYEAVARGLHGHDLTKKEQEEEKQRRRHTGVNNGIPLPHKGFNKDDRKRLSKAAEQDRDKEKK